MYHKLIESKLHAPRSPANLLSRGRLLGLLESSLGQEKMSILMSAPAGYGKTSLAADWLTKSAACSAWLTLDKSDNDLTRFIQYVYTAVQRATEIAESTALAFIEAPVHPPEEDLAAAVVNDLATIRSKTVLLLDDYHKIANRSVHGIVSHLLQYSPPSVVVAILTREDPPFPLARLRTQDLLLELRAQELRFNATETKEFIESSAPVKLEASDSAELAAKTEGWAAGLKLAALSLESLSEQDSRRLVADFSGSNRYVIDYFGEEVLQNLPRNVTSFLSDTAHHAKLCADLCNAVTGRSDSAQIITTLIRKNLFITPIDGEEGWYRYHPLFAGFLRMKFQSAKTAELHQKAAGWYADRKMYYEAMRHVEQIADRKILRRVISEAAISLLEGGRYENLLHWLDLFAQEVLLDDIKLVAYKGWALYFQNHAEDAFDLLLQCERKNPTWRKSDLIILGSWLRDALGEPVSLSELGECIGTKKGVERFFLLHAFFLHGKICLRSGDPKGALRSAEAAGQLAEEYGNPFFVACAAHLQAYCRIELGHRSQAEKLCDRMVVKLGEDNGRGEVFSGMLRIPAAFCRYLVNDITGAALQLKEAQGDFDSRLITDYTIDNGSRIKALISLAAGDYEKAAAVNCPVTKGEYPSLREYIVADIALKKNEVEKAAKTVKIDRPDVITGGASLTDYGCIVKLRLLLALEEPAYAEAILRKMEAVALQNEAVGSLILINVFLSLVKHKSGEKSQAQDHMLKALGLAETQDYRRPFLDEGRHVEEIVRGIEPQAHSFAGSLLSDFKSLGSYSSSLPRAFSEKISKRECEVISLMAKGMSNQEVADALFISLGTVKWHVNNIFGKLDVKNRTSAIIRARELGLISD